MHITAIVPAYNEEKTIRNVLFTLSHSRLIDKIIAVDDGSTDNTLNIMKEFMSCSNKIKVISNKKNIGKGESVKKAAKNLKTDIVFLCDADLIDLKAHHIARILNPVIRKKASMCIGLREKRNKLRNWIDKNFYIHFFPLISGERAINYPVLKEIMKNNCANGYGLEITMNKYCKKNKLPIETTVLRGCDHIPKKTFKSFNRKIKTIYGVIRWKRL